MKKLISAYATAIALAAGLLGCNLDAPPISAATCTTYVSGTPGPRRPLTITQRQALSKWLTEHRTEWSRTVATHVPRTVIEMEHEGGTTSLNLWSRLLIASGPFGQYQRTLSEDEARTLAGIVDPDGAVLFNGAPDISD
jgi:hypothetical protein